MAALAGELALVARVLGDLAHDRLAESRGVGRVAAEAGLVTDIVGAAERGRGRDRPLHRAWFRRLCGFARLRRSEFDSGFVQVAAAETLDILDEREVVVVL